MAQHWATEQREGSINYLKSKTHLAKTYILVQPVHEGNKEGACSIRGYKDSSGGQLAQVGIAYQDQPVYRYFWSTYDTLILGHTPEVCGWVETSQKSVELILSNWISWNKVNPILQLIYLQTSIHLKPSWSGQEISNNRIWSAIIEVKNKRNVLIDFWGKHAICIYTGRWCQDHFCRYKCRQR